VPYPTSLVDWPELRVRSAVSEPDEPLLVLLLVEWPARERLATALIALEADNGEAMRLLTQWRDEWNPADRLVHNDRCCACPGRGLAVLAGWAEKRRFRQMRQHGRKSSGFHRSAQRLDGRCLQL
jgi:hypothetical protein